MSDIISMHRADLVDAVTEAVKPLKARIDALEAELAERTAQRDAAGNEGMRLAAELADKECIYKREHRMNSTLINDLHLQRAVTQDEKALRQTAEGYAARNALRVIELEADLEHKEAYYAQFTLTPKPASALETGAEHDCLTANFVVRSGELTCSTCGKRASEIFK
jgi:hypothetical protein